jgi:hypothetical protein
MRTAMMVVVQLAVLASGVVALLSLDQQSVAVTGQAAPRQTTPHVKPTHLRLFTRPACEKRPFVVTACVSGLAKRKVWLELPPDLSLAPGEAREKETEVQPGRSFATVSWLVISSKNGDFVLRAHLGSIVVEETARVFSWGCTM